MSEQSLKMLTDHVMYIEVEGHQQLGDFFQFLRKEFNCDKDLKEEFLSNSSEEFKEDVVKDEVEEDDLDKKDEKIEGANSDHDQSQSNICDICGKQFKQAKSLKTHLASHAIRKHSCEQCDYKAKWKKNLYEHIRSMHKDSRAPHAPSLTCEMCGAQFRHHTSLNYHREKVHLDVTFPCDLCDQVFKTRRSLGDHKQNHGQVYRCELCNKDFPLMRRLVNHNRKVHGPNAVKKKGRSYKFVNSNNETRSRMEHLGGQFWRCVVCDYKSNKSTNVYKHIESKHGAGQEYECKLCHKVFKGMNVYHNHIYKAHRSK